MKRILIIEDDELLATILQEMLASKLYEVHVLRKGSTAVDLVRQSKPDLVLLDIMLPDVDGHQVCQELKGDAKLAGIPVLVITALNRIEDQEKALAHGADDYLGKPFEYDRLLSKIEKLLGLTNERR